jgi:hypothetical protein
MTLRETLGLALLIVGTALVPLGWIVSHKILLLAFLLDFVGFWLFYTERILKQEIQQAKDGVSSGSYGVHYPGDMNNYTGWRTGGRTETFDSSEGGSDGD